MSSTFANGTVRVTTPPSYDAQEPAATRGLPDPAQLNDARGHTELLAALQDSDLDLVQTVDLTPRRSRDLDARGPGARHGPARHRRVRGRGRGGAARARRRLLVAPAGRHGSPYALARARDRRPARFEIDVQPVPGAAAPAPTDRHDRGLLGSVVEGAAHALVFRFVAPALMEKAVEKMEEHVKTGLVHLTDVEVSSWTRFETLDELHLPTDRPVRVLLFIHGTFSSTAGGFGALGVGENGPRLPAHGDLGVRRRHRLRPQDPQRRPEAERRGPAEAAADPPARGRARLRHRHAQPRRADHALVRRAGAPAEQLAGERRQHRLRRLDPWRHPPRRPRALVGHGRPLHQPRRRLGQGADDGRCRLPWGRSWQGWSRASGPS